jgi:predicted Fe-S protein YdhL (DUF1289 family)
MGNEARQRQRIESPCVKICVIDQTDRLCTGCLRSLDEIARWSTMTPEERAQAQGDIAARS